MAWLALAVVVGPGCTATVQRHRLRSVDALIESSDADGLNVRIHGGRYRIPAEQIDDIDHPGNVLMVVGLATSALGGALMVAAQTRRGEDNAVLMFPAVMYLGIGLGMTIGGGIPWAQSRGRAMQYEHGSKAERPYLPIDCAPISGADLRKCPEPAPTDTLPLGVR